MLQKKASFFQDPSRTPAVPPKPASSSRKYTLEELEVEGFADDAAPPDLRPRNLRRIHHQTASDDEDEELDGEEELFDLSSLIEGAVDDDEDLEGYSGYHTALEDQAAGQVISYLQECLEGRSSFYFKIDFTGVLTFHFPTQNKIIIVFF